MQFIAFLGSRREVLYTSVCLGFNHMRELQVVLRKKKLFIEICFKFSTQDEIQTLVLGSLQHNTMF